MNNLQINQVEKSFGSLRVLKNLHLDVPPGSFTVLLGPSGCGKSTLLNAIAGLEDIDSGEIVIGGRDVTHLEPKDRDIAMVFQSYALYPTKTVRKNMSFGLEIAGLPRDEIDKRVQRAAEILQLSELLDRKPLQLSGGQRQRAAIGRAIVRDPKVFLFDEPLSNLDAKLRAEMRIELKKLHERLNATMVYVTHDQIEAMTMADQIAVMNGGVIEQIADPQTLYDVPETLFVAGFIGAPAMNFLRGEIFKANGGVAAQIAGHEVPLAHYPFRNGIDEGRKVIVGIRPERIGPQDTNQGHVTFDTKLDLVEPMGADTLAWFDFAGQPVSARLAPKQVPPVHENVTLGFDLADVSLFDSDTGYRL